MGQRPTPAARPDRFQRPGVRSLPRSPVSVSLAHLRGRGRPPGRVLDAAASTLPTPRSAPSSGSSGNPPRVCGHRRQVGRPWTRGKVGFRPSKGSSGAGQGGSRATIWPWRASVAVATIAVSPCASRADRRDEVGDDLPVPVPPAPAGAPARRRRPRGPWRPGPSRVDPDAGHGGGQQVVEGRHQSTVCRGVTCAPAAWIACGQGKARQCRTQREVGDRLGKREHRRRCTHHPRPLTSRSPRRRPSSRSSSWPDRPASTPPTSCPTATPRPRCRWHTCAP